MKHNYIYIYVNSTQQPPSTFQILPDPAPSGPRHRKKSIRILFRRALQCLSPPHAPRAVTLRLGRWGKTLPGAAPAFKAPVHRSGTKKNMGISRRKAIYT